jgi:hypothetical protein
LERVTGIEPVSLPWQGSIIPLYDTRKKCKIEKLKLGFDPTYERSGYQNNQMKNNYNLF